MPVLHGERITSKLNSHFMFFAVFPQWFVFWIIHLLIFHRAFRTVSALYQGEFSFNWQSCGSLVTIPDSIIDFLLYGARSENLPSENTLLTSLKFDLMRLFQFSHCFPFYPVLYSLCRIAISQSQLLAPGLVFSRGTHFLTILIKLLKRPRALPMSTFLYLQWDYLFLLLPANDYFISGPLTQVSGFLINWNNFLWSWRDRQVRVFGFQKQEFE